MRVENIKIGEYFTNEQVRKLFKVSGQSGMMKSNRLDAIVLISIEENGVYKDSGIEDGKILYTGEGLRGNQHLKANNKTLYNSLEEDLYVYLFTKDDKKIYTFEGRVKLYNKPFQTSEPDADNNIRNVWKFPLQIIYSNVEDKKQEDDNFFKIINKIEAIDENVIVEANKDELIFKDEPLKIRKYRKNPEKRKLNRSAKPEYIAIEIIKNKQGVINEDVIFQNELKLMIDAGADEQAKKMKDFFDNRKDDEGYDILSYELNENNEYIEKYIEVKSTKSDEGTPIDISDNEVEFAKKHINQYYIYRIIKSDSKDRYVKIVKGKELFENYEFIPTMYKIYSK